ncbi:MAG: Protein containing Heat shock protein Hsp20 protein [Candidatus Nomurabacteria bacterium GW2011_GWB1_37_5]|uniref:Protein containing Heat shock protein Hsp20 protein n=1 Tax=Candidatus Nomurabacteria bacterium GW2011_GWB1_37_5 TaxID=1618742 RepID=A0A0G0GYW8_9BACT|nr:MAG: Protein containing Heat shock protein Hsp20 protein [Candidatus Nomurabacteria bacterium GW2011_GWB1_37_5]
MKKRSFFEKLTGGMKMDEDDNDIIDFDDEKKLMSKMRDSDIDEEDTEEAQLTVDVYQTPSDIVVQAMVAGVKPEDLQVEIGRDMVTIRGKREENRSVADDDFFVQELYWGSFSRTILLPQEIEPEEAEAMEKHGLLIIKMPKIDKTLKTSLKIKSV